MLIFRQQPARAIARSDALHALDRGEDVAGLRGTHGDERTSVRFETREFIDTFLNPATQPGCRTHRSDSCLCDVDVSKTAGISWDRLPTELVDVNDVDALVLAAANIWLNVDLLGGNGHDEIVWQESIFTDPRLLEAGSLIRDGATLKDVRKILPSMVPTNYKLLRRVYGLRRGGSKAGKNRTLPWERVWELASSGMRIVDIHKLLLSEGIKCSSSRVGNLVREQRARNAAEPAKVKADADSA